MALILNIETSAEACSVALTDGISLLAEARETQPRSHASKLAVLIDQVMNQAGILRSDLNAVAVSAGPGSYTGLRIGVATAKGLCYGLSIPLIAVNTLDILIAQVNQSQKINARLLCPMIDARRMEVYCKIVDNKNIEIEEMKSIIVDQLTFSHHLQQQSICFFGSGAMKCKSVIQHPNAIFVDDVFPDASGMRHLAFEKLVINETEDLISFEPFYIKEFLIKKSRKEVV
ncbi:MAG: tRNA (adenosine(37)-N6)-threonylcarbamoyltransferase complex dimerization subunit type 1 TsaB [Cyclobacteriaceae bacterium]